MSKISNETHPQESQSRQIMHPLPTAFQHLALLSLRSGQRANQSKWGLQRGCLCPHWKSFESTCDSSGCRSSHRDSIMTFHSSWVMTFLSFRCRSARRSVYSASFAMQSSVLAREHFSSFLQTSRMESFSWQIFFFFSQNQ